MQVFPKGSPLVPDISRTILKVTEEIDKKLYRNKTTCPDQNNSASSDSLTLESFWGLFLITGITSTSALILFLVFFLYEHRHVLKTADSDTSIWKRLAIIAKLMDQKDNSSQIRKKSNPKVELTEDVEGWPYTDDALQNPSCFRFPSEIDSNSGPEDEKSPKKSVL